MTWGLDDKPGIREQYISTHPCTKQELGLIEDNDEKSSFYSIHKNSYNDTITYWQGLNCLDEPIEIQGDYNSYKGRVLKFVFEKCSNQTIEEGVCKTDQEITRFLRRKFITTLQNQVRFDTMKYDDTRLVKESVFCWYPINSLVRQEIAL